MGEESCLSQKVSLSCELWRKWSCWILAFSWVFGLISGMAACCYAERTLTSWMRRSVYGTVSISGLLLVNILPVLLSALAVFLSSPVLLLVLCVCKAFLSGFVSLGVLVSFGSAGWLYRRLFLFSDCLILPVLYGYWLQCLNVENRKIHLYLHTLFTLAVASGVFFTDFYVISPYLACLIDF